MANPKSHDWRSKSRVALLAAVLALAFSQILLGAHAAKYGDDPHDHFGQACVLSLAAPGGDKAVGAASFVLLASITLFGLVLFAHQKEPARVKIRAARSRGPPNL